MAAQSDRLLGIDTKESQNPRNSDVDNVTQEGKDASNFMKLLVPDDKEVVDGDTLRGRGGDSIKKTVYGTDALGRKLTKAERKITVDGIEHTVDLQIIMMHENFSDYYTKYDEHPNPADHELYKHYYADYTQYELSGGINPHTGMPQGKQGKEYASLSDDEFNSMTLKSNAFKLATAAFKEGKIDQKAFDRATVHLFSDTDMLVRYQQDMFDRTQPKFNDGSLRYRAGLLQQDPTQVYITNLAKANNKTLSATVRKPQRNVSHGEAFEASFAAYNTVAMASDIHKLYEVRNYGKTDNTAYTDEEILEGAPAYMHQTLLEEAELNNGMSAIVMKEQYMQDEKNNDTLAQLNVLESIGYGFLPFLLDVPTLITGGTGVALKGVVAAGRSAVVRTAPAWSKVGVDFGAAATVWGTAAAYDESIRASVRLTSDHTYDVKAAQMDIGVAFATGGILAVGAKGVMATPLAKRFASDMRAVHTAEANRVREFNDHKAGVEVDVQAGRTMSTGVFGDFVVDTANAKPDIPQPFYTTFEYVVPDIPDSPARQQALLNTFLTGEKKWRREYDASPAGQAESKAKRDAKATRIATTVGKPNIENTPIIVDKVADMPPVTMTDPLNARHYIEKLNTPEVQAAYMADVERSVGKVATGIQKQGGRGASKKGVMDYVADLVSLQWAGNAFTSVGQRFQKSGLASGEWISKTITENPRGNQGKVNRTPTAALIKDRENHLSQMRIAPQYVEGITAYATSKGKGALSQLNAATMDSNNPIVDAFHKEVFELQEARRRGRPTNNFHESVVKTADDWDKYMAHNHDTLVKSGVDNFTKERKVKHYIPRKWSIAKTKSMIAKHGKRAVYNTVLAAYRELDARMGQQLDANGKPLNAGKRAEEFIEHILGDQSVTNAGEAAQRAIDLDDAFTPTTDIHSRTRADFDLDIGSGGLTMMDLVNTDLPEIWTKYSERMSAQVGLAKATNGVITSPLDIQATRQLLEQEAIDKGMSRSEMNKHIGMFDDVMDTLFGRPTKYFNTGGALSRAEKILTGTNYTGVPKSVRQIKDITALTQLGGLGAAQASEIGATITRAIMQAWGDEKTVKGLLKQSGVNVDDPTALKSAYHEIQEISGITDEIEWMDRQSVHLDQHEQANIGTLHRAGDAVIDAMTFGKYKAPAARLLGKTTGFNALRKNMNRVAQSSAVLDLVKQAKHGKGSMSKQRRMDLGLEDQSIFDEINKHVELNDDGYVVTLNFDQWKPDVMEKLALGIHRDTAQTVQRTLVGERPSWLNRPMAQLVTQYMEMPIVAMNKQLGRQIAFADKEAVVGMSLQAAVAGTVMYSWKELSTAVTGNTEEQEDITDMDSMVKSKAFQALKYAPFVGVVPDVMEWVNAGIQQESKNIPLMSTLNNYWKAGEEVQDLATGTGSVKDLMDTTRRLVPLSNTIYGKALAEQSAKLAEKMQ